MTIANDSAESEFRTLAQGMKSFDSTDFLRIKISQLQIEVY